MTHPNPEEWIPYLCGEAQPEARQRLGRHLRECPECEARLADWQRSFSALDTWKIPPMARSQRRAFAIQPQWAAGMAAMLMAGFVLGYGVMQARASSRLAAAEEKWKAFFAAELSAQMRQEMETLVSARVDAELDLALPDLAQAARRELDLSLSMFSQYYNQTRDEDRATNEARLGGMEARLQAQYLTLRQDLETVATLTYDEFGRTKDNLRRLLASASITDSIQQP